MEMVSWDWMTCRQFWSTGTDKAEKLNAEGAHVMTMQRVEWTYRVFARFAAFAIIMMTCLVATTAHARTVWHVDKDAPCLCPAQNQNAGKSWALPFKYLQDALENPALADGDTIKVAQLAATQGALGAYAYYPDERCCFGPHNTNERFESFVIRNISLTILGGYPGYDQPNPDVRNPELYDDTILSGDLQQNDGPGPFQGYGENSYHVVRMGDPSDQPPPDITEITVDGFKITAGFANGTGSVGELGAGVLIDGSLECDPSTCDGPTLQNCFFELNWANAAGGGLGTRKIGVILLRSRFLTNRSDGSESVGGGQLGGAGASVSGPMDAVECLFSGNEARDQFPALPNSGYGGGLEHTEDATLINCEFRDNVAHGGGGGAHLSIAELTNCLFYSNDALGTGTGGAQGGGGAKLSTGTLYNCTFASNHATTTGGGAHVIGSNIVRNSIFWNNTANGCAPNDWDCEEVLGVACPEYCCIQDYVFGSCLCDAPSGETSGCPGMTSEDPRFVDLANGDLRLSKPCSSCVDAGDKDDGGTDNTPRPVPGGYSLPCALTCVAGHIRCESGPPIYNVDDDDNTSEPTPDLANPWFMPPQAQVNRVFDGDGDNLSDSQIDIGAYEFVRKCCPWDCQDVPNGNVGIEDLLAELAQWGACCTSCDHGHGAPCVGIEDHLTLLARWGTICSADPLLCPGGESNGPQSESSSSEATDALAIALWTMGFENLEAYGEWALTATDAEALETGLILAALLGG